MAYNTAASAADSLLNMIGQDIDWQWANNDLMLQNLRNSKAKVQDIINESNFARDSFTLPMDVVKKKYGEGFEQKVAMLCETMDDPLKKLSAETNRLIKMSLAQKET